MLSGNTDDGDSWTLRENELGVSDSTMHPAIVRAGKKQRTASSTVYMLLGALPVEAEIHKRQLSFLHAVSSDNKCLQEAVQRQLACSFNNEFSFFYMVTQVLEKYCLPSLSQLITSEIGRAQWKILCK